jgi:predicted membrane metal-binding protein
MLPMNRRYTSELLAALAAYALLLYGSIAVLKQFALPSPWRDVIALAPMLAFAAGCHVILRQLQRIDEMQRRIQLEALGFAFAGTAMLSFGYGFLEGLAYPRLSMFWIWPVMAALWCIGLAIARRRYA